MRSEAEPDRPCAYVLLMPPGTPPSFTYPRYAAPYRRAARKVTPRAGRPAPRGACSAAIISSRIVPVRVIDAMTAHGIAAAPG